MQLFLSSLLLIISVASEAQKHPCISIDTGILTSNAILNDDYCDCVDGSDELMTSACANSKFQCLNIGAAPKIIPSSYVHDSLCDCCDGSDERAGVCNNTCAELGSLQVKKKAELESIRIKGLKKKADVLKIGGILDDFDRSEVEKGLKVLEKAIEKEAKLKDEMKLWEERKDNLDLKIEQKRSLACATEIVQVKDAKDKYWELMEVYKVVVAKLEASLFAVDGTENPEITVEIDGFKSHFKEFLDDEAVTKETLLPIEPIEDEPCVLLSGEWYNCLLRSFSSSTSSSFTSSQIEKSLRRVEDSITKIESEISTIASSNEKIQKRLGINFGGERAWRGFYQSCVDFTDSSNGFVYTVCLGDYVKQKDASSNTIPLGVFSKVEGNMMLFTEGQKCWNGPSRSVQLIFECGNEFKILSVAEPSKCVYEMKGVSPIVCRDDLVADVVSEEL